MRYHELLNQIQSAKIAPVYLFHGEDDFLIEEAIARLKKAVLTSSGMEDLNYHLLSGSAADSGEVIQLCQTLPVLCKWRLVIVREAEDLSESEALVPYLDHPSSSTCLVLVARKLDQRRRIVSILKAKTVEVLFHPLTDSQLTVWIREISRSIGISLAPEAMDYLKERLGNDLHHIQNELEKIALTLHGTRKVAVHDLENHLTGDREHSVFEWLDAVTRRDQETAIRLLTSLLDSGEYPLSLLGLLLSHFRRALRSAQLGRYGSVSRPGSRHQRPAFSAEPSERIRAFTLCLRADSNLKGSKLSPQLILENLVLQLCGKGQEIQGLGMRSRSGSGLGGGTGFPF